MTIAPGLLERLVGIDACIVELAGEVVDTGLVTGYSATHGRSDPTGDLDAGTCVVQMRSDATTRLPRVGDLLTIQLGPDALDWAGLVDLADQDAARWRFVGNVTDVTAAAGRPVTDPGVVTVTATTLRARLGRTYVGDVPWPAESDAARAARILALAAPQVGATVGTVDAGTVDVVGRDVDRRAALELLSALAVDTGGAMVELRNGDLTWQDANHRGRIDPAVTLTAGQVLASVTATQKLAGIVNQLTVSYGPAVEEGSRPTVYVEDPPSVDPVTGFGPFGATLNSQLLAEADAAAFARLTVGRRSAPYWSLSSLTVDLLRTVPQAVAGAMLQLEHSSLLAVDGFPASGPFTAARLWVEGWTESVSRHEWRLQLAVSAYGRSGPALRFLDVPDDITFADVPDDLTFLRAVAWDTSTT